MKSIYTILFALALTVSTAFGQQSMVLTPLAANTASNVLTGAKIIDNITVLNATTNAATLKFYDSGTTATNYVQAAYTSYASYATNFNVVFTNQNNVLVTNTFAGIYTAPTSNTLATNTRPAVLTVVIPANTSLNKDVKLQTILGLTAIGDQALTLITTYRTTY